MKRLGVLTDHRGPGYAIPGALTYTITITALAGYFLLARPFAWICTVFLMYFVARAAVTFAYTLHGERKRREWEMRDWSVDELTIGAGGFAPADVRHLVIVPAYKEPLDLLRRTLDRIAEQRLATERLIVVLGLEEREEGAEAKGALLAEEYRDRFARFLVTVHPAGALPGEVPGKGSNETWAAMQARPLLDEMGIEPERTTISSCDADSLFHPAYFEALSHLFAKDEERYSAFWQAPLFYYNNLWDVAAPVRFPLWFAHGRMLGELAMPFYSPLPISTYSTSLVLMEGTGWWDPAIISEDWHSFLRCAMYRGGKLRMRPVFLPTHADAVDGDGLLGGLRAYHAQTTRHCWGAEDVGYMFHEILSQDRPNRFHAFRFTQVAHEHVMRVVAWVLVFGAYVLNAQARIVTSVLGESTAIASAAGSLSDAGSTAGGALPDPSAFIPYLFAVGAFAMVGTLLLEIWRNPPPPGHRARLRLPFELAFMWLLLPWTGLYLGVIPALKSQSRLMLGMPFSFNATAKRITANATAYARK